MVESIIQDQRGFLLINSIDKNNDSPAHLAAFRGQFEILKILTKNNAFLDQPNAESKDPIETIVSEEKRIKFIEELKGMKLSEKNTKHIGNLWKKYSNNQAATGTKVSTNFKSGGSK